MQQPAWFLLLFAALVASLVAAMLGFTARSRLGESSPRRAVLIGFALGIVLWGPVYGFAFELVGSARALGGAALGALHGLIAAGIALLRTRRAPGGRSDGFASIQGRRLITRVVYGAVLGFLYVVPTA